MSEIQELVETVRRQGRAAVAAQAAAESCLGALERIEARLTPPDDAELVRGLIPFVDAMRRVAGEARSLDQAPSSFLERLLRPRSRGRIESMLRGIQLLEAQLSSVLEACRVEIDSELDVPVDGERHRVVSTRREGPPGRVLEVLRPGYAYRGRLLREAEVVASDRAASSAQAREAE